MTSSVPPTLPLRLVALLEDDDACADVISCSICCNCCCNCAICFWSPFSRSSCSICSSSFSFSCSSSLVLDELEVELVLLVEFVLDWLFDKFREDEDVSTLLCA